MRKCLKENSNDGWSDTIRDIVEEFGSEVEQVLYEVRNCVRGSYGGFGSTSADLAGYLRDIAGHIESAADEIENLPEADLEESVLKEDNSRFDKDFYDFLSETFDSYDGSYHSLVQDVRSIEKDWVEEEEDEDPNYLADLRGTVRSTGEAWLRQKGRELCSEELLGD